MTFQPSIGYFSQKKIVAVELLQNIRLRLEIYTRKKMVPK